MATGKFGKSESNSRTERSGVEVLLSDPRFQQPDLATKKEILRQLGLESEYKPQSFDAVMSPETIQPLEPKSVARHLDRLRIIEMKTTMKPIRSVALNNFFFGATAREFELAERLGDRYLFAFVVLSTANLYGRPFAVLMTKAQLDERIRTKRIQFQVNFRSDLDDEAAVQELVVFET